MRRVFSLPAGPLSLLVAVCSFSFFPGGSAPLGADETAVIFASRERVSNVGSPPVRRAEIGRLLYLEIGRPTRAIVDGSAGGVPIWTPKDILSPEVSYDARRVLFSGYSRVEKGWRIFEVGIDGTGLRQITHSDRSVDLSRYGELARKFEGHDDLDPCYLPDGRICLASTRYPGFGPNGRLRATNLYIVNGDGGNLHRITTERFGADTPAVDPSSGRIVYSRWWRTPQTAAESLPVLPVYYGPPPPAAMPPVPSVDPSALRVITDKEFPGFNSWTLAGVNPDGTGLSMITGFPLDRATSQSYNPTFLPNGEILSLFLLATPTIGDPQLTGLRAHRPGARPAEVLGGPSSGTVPGFGVFLGVPQGRENEESLQYVFASATAHPSGNLLVTAAPTAKVFGTSGGMYDVYLLDRESRRMRPIYRNTLTMDIDAVPVVSRNPPPSIPDRVGDLMVDEAPRDAAEAAAQGGTFTFLVENIHFNAPVDVPVPSAPPVGYNLSIEFYMAPQGEKPIATEKPILLQRQAIGPDGRIEATLPAGVPLFEVLRRPDGKIGMGRDGQVFHVGGMNFGRAGQTARCAGCHAGHSMIEVPEDASWTNLAPSASVDSTPRTRMPDVPIVDGNGAANGLLPPFFASQNLVDRRTNGLASWIGDLSNPPTKNVITLKWSVPIRARELVIHPAGGKTGPEGFVAPIDFHPQAIRGFAVRTILSGTVEEEFEVREEIRSGGQKLSRGLNPGRPFDILELTIAPKDVSGQFVADLPGPALGEIEVIAQDAGLATQPAFFFLRGDANCDLKQDLSDANVILGSLFLGKGPLCCAAAADTNGDGTLNLSDPVALLNYMFLGGESPPEPSAHCGRAVAGVLRCETETCR